MITTCDIVEFGDAFICRDERTLLIVESKGANSEARERAHKESTLIIISILKWIMTTLKSLSIAYDV